MAKEENRKVQDKLGKDNVLIDEDILKDKQGNQEFVQEESAYQTVEQIVNDEQVREEQVHTELDNEPKVNREHKDGLFRMLFADKRELLNLYNALSGRHYQDPERRGKVEGIEQGRESELISLIRRKSQNGLDTWQISDFLELEESYVKQVIQVIKKNSNMSDLEIVEKMQAMEVI